MILINQNKKNYNQGIIFKKLTNLGIKTQKELKDSD